MRTVKWYGGTICRILPAGERQVRSVCSSRRGSSHQGAISSHSPALMVPVSARFWRIMRSVWAGSAAFSIGGMLIALVLLGNLGNPIFAQTSALINVIVADTMPGSAAQDAGMRSGDILIGWQRGESKGEFGGPFELSLIETEQGGRGTVTIRGRRGENTLTWDFAGAPWGIVPAPRLKPEAAATHREGVDLLKTKRLQMPAPAGNRRRRRLPARRQSGC